MTDGRPPTAAVRAAGRAGDRHRRRAPGHRRVHPRPARAGRLRARRARPVGRHRFGARRVPRRRGDRRRAAAARADAVPDVVAGLARRCRVGRRGARLRQRAGRHHARWSMATSGPRRRPARPDPRGSTPRRCGAATSPPGCGWPSLYDRSVTWGGLVVGTGNKTESLIGYTTLFGDSACAFNPIGDLYKSQVRQLAVAIGVPDAIVRKAPIGRPVAGPDRRGRGRVQLPGARPAAVLADRQAAVDRGDGRARLRRARWSSGSTGWSPAPSSSARSRRSPSSGRGRPASTTSTRGGGRARRAGDGRGVRGASASPAARCTSSPRRSATSATSRSGRSRSCARPAHRGRGHAPHAPPARPPRDRDADDELPRAERRRRGRGAARAPARRGGPRARHRRRHARRQRSRARSSSRRGRPRAAGSCRSRARRRCSPRSRRAGVAGPRWAFEGFLPRTGRERRERLAPDRRRRARHGPVRGAGAGRGDAARPRRGVRRGPAGGRLPRADQAPRDDRPRLARRARRGGRGRRRSRRAASSRSWSGRGRTAGRSRPRRRPTPSRPRGPRSSGWWRPGRPAARRPGRSRPRPGSPRRRLYGADRVR